MVPISNALIGRAGFNVEQLVLQDILTAISVREDKAFMRDDGTGDTPIGMKARATQWNRLLPWEADAAINLNTVDEYRQDHFDGDGRQQQYDQQRLGHVEPYLYEVVWAA